MTGITIRIILVSWMFLIVCCGSGKPRFKYYRPQDNAIFPIKEDSLFARIQVIHRCEQEAAGSFAWFSNCKNDYVIRAALYGQRRLLSGQSAEFMSVKIVSETSEDTIELIQKDMLKSVVPFSNCASKKVRSYCSEDVFFIGKELSEFAGDEFEFLVRIRLTSDNQEYSYRKKFIVRD